jgi:hypothetical protein
MARNNLKLRPVVGYFAYALYYSRYARHENNVMRAMSRNPPRAAAAAMFVCMCCRLVDSGLRKLLQLSC